MTDLYLHHYAGSMFSEKIRVLLGYLDLPWRSVTIAPIMPRPALMPLTGGYRRTPVMQEGADIYCDTRVIAERLAELARRPDLTHGFVPNRVAEWADSQLFRIAVAVTFQPRVMMATMSRTSGADMAAFQKDRAELSKGAVITTLSPGAAEEHLSSYLEELDQSLADAFLFGSKPCIADFSVYHCLWLIANNRVVAPLLEGHPNVTAWRARMAAFGHGDFEVDTPEAALEVGRASTPRPATGSPAGLPADVDIGDEVTVTPTDYGLVPVRGRLISCSRREVAIARNDALAGDVVVHFPRIGFAVKKV